ncbi:MAG: hypothetical protein CR979_03580 [Propionibacterium sp.]|nr:MAG: hypothetical protein CR979_03580 [Propionibacterium sp.]
MEEEERTVFMTGVENEYDAFVSWVSKARDIPTYKIRQDLGAYIFSPKQAKENGLIDSIMGPDEAFNHIAESMGIKKDKVRVVRPADPSPFESLLGAENRIYGQINAVGPEQKVTNTLCSGDIQILAFHGSTKAICG